MELKVKLYLSVVALSCLIWSCSLFRKSEQSYTHKAVRDSSRSITEGVDLSKVIVFNGTGSVLELTAEGFRVLEVKSDGTVNAEGENGKLNVKRNDFSGQGENRVDSTSHKSESLAVQDSVRNEGQSASEGKASPDTWFNWWWVLVLGAVFVIAWLVFLKKFDFKSLFK